MSIVAIAVVLSLIAVTVAAAPGVPVLAGEQEEEERRQACVKKVMSQ